MNLPSKTILGLKTDELILIMVLVVLMRENADPKLIIAIVYIML